MTALSDTLTIGLVLVLLFGSIALYLYTRIQQAEQKITLLEHILLDLKMSAEVKTYSELPAEQSGSSSAAGASYQPFLSDDEDDDDIDVAPGATVKAYNSPSSSTRSSATSSVVMPSALEEDQQLSDKVELESYKDIIDNAIKVDADLEVEVKREVSEAKVSVNYESMTLKDLQSIAKQRGITSATTMKKAQIIEALKTSDRATSVIAEPIEPGSLSGSSSFLETSTFLGQDSD